MRFFATYFFGQYTEISYDYYSLLYQLHKGSDPRGNTMRAAIAVLSTENLLHNVAVIKQRAPSSLIMAMIKANAYGHGLRSTALRLQHHVATFGVASIDEALALRAVGIKIPITLMQGVFEPDEYLVASCQQFHIVLHEYQQLAWLNQISFLPSPLTIWLKIDTGMGRLGFQPTDVANIQEQLACNPFIKHPIGLMSHFACSEDYEHPLNQQQIATFKQCTQQLQQPKSLCNSAAIFHFPDQHYAMVRPGIALYGISPIAGISAHSLGLKPVMTLQTRLIAVRMVNKGTSLGYGARFICPEDMPVGVIAMGYGDGYPRTARNGTPVLVNGIRCPLVGRISMDMMTVDLRPHPHAQVNDQVTLWGQELPLEEVAPHTDSIPYDMLTAVQSRVKFHWTIPT